MASARIEGAAKGAQVGGQVGGPVGSGVGAILGGLFSKGSYAEATGYDIQGALTSRGFEGSIVGLASNKGEQYRDVASGELRQLSASMAEHWRNRGLTADDAPIPFSGVIPYDFSLAFSAAEKAIDQAAADKSGTVLDRLRGSAGGSPAGSAPILSSVPAGVPSTMQPASILPSQPDNSGGFALPLLALLAGAAYVMR